LLEVRGLDSGYGNLEVLWSVSLNVEEAEFVTLLGPNGAGKTTTLKTIAGLIRPKAGEIEFMGSPIGGLAPHRIQQMGISLITEELNLFPQMSVHENLILGAYRLRDKEKISTLMDYVMSLFPRLHERASQLAGTLSGGERKMLALGRGLMSEPKMLLVDEPSLGLAPNLAGEVFAALEELNHRGMAILLVEQNVRMCLNISTRTYVLENGRIVLEGQSREFLQNEHVKKAYLAIL
jgi:branched-chain amino acid transport system ATP-binding protein